MYSFNHSIKNIVFIPLIIFTAFCYSCRSVKPRDYVVRDKNQKKISSFVPRADLDNMLRMITYGGKLSNDNLPIRLSTRYVVPDFNTEITYTSDERVNDILKTYSYDVTNNINTNENAGNKILALKFEYYDEKRSWISAYFAAFRIFLPHLLGVPIGTVKSTMKIHVSLLNEQQETIKTYYGHGSGRSWIGLYWSYGRDAKRKAAIKAFKNTMAGIKTQIHNDSLMLRSALYKP
jgi:hypothetical protein